MFNIKSYEFDFYKNKPVKNMYISRKKLSGRSSKGLIILEHRGGGLKRHYKILDFIRFFRFLPAKVVKIEYDTNRLVFLCLIAYINGCLSYILAPSLININDFIYSNLKNYMVLGGVFFLYRIPLGTFVHNVELRFNFGAIFSRAAGTVIQLLKKIGYFILVRLPSKEERFLSLKNSATIGKVSYELKKFIYKKKAGINIKRGLKPVVRGVVKNAIDHPHGGGRGRTTAGRPSVTPWGIYTKGVRTTNRFIKNRLFKWGFFKRRTGIIW